VTLLAAGYKLLAEPDFTKLIIFFPFGLARILGLRLSPIGDSRSVPVLFAAWVIYVLLTIAIFLVPQGRAFRALYVVLLVLLTLNVGGCHMMLTHR